MDGWCGWMNRVEWMKLDGWTDGWMTELDGQGRGTIPWRHGLHVALRLLEDVGAGVGRDRNVGRRDGRRAQVSHLVLEEVVVLVAPKVFSVLP